VTVPSDDYYELLGVPRSASADEIKRAYRRLARELHPDTNADPHAGERFKEISVAYATLSDPEKRRRYDMFGPERTAAGASGADFVFNDLFEAFFGRGDPFGTGRSRGPAGPARGPDVEARLDVTLEEVVHGATRTLDLRLPITCPVCDGSGCAAGTHPQTCSDCQGAGEVRAVRRSILGQVITSAPCPRCGADGTIIPQPCDECRGEGRVEGPRTIEIDVPAGIDTGQRLRLAGRGPAARRGGPSGDIYVGVRVLPHPRFERSGDDLVHALRLPLTQAVLGAHLSLETIDGAEELTVEAGTQPGTVLRMRGRGVPSLANGRRGDLLVELLVDIPERLSEEEVELFTRLAELRGEDVAEPEQGLFSRIRSAFQ
jgi:molecular chaperone DnaJ